MQFLGTFDYAMDERGRVPLPPRYRDAFRSGIVLSQGSPDKCVRAYTSEAFEEQSRLVASTSPLSARGRDLRRFFFSNAHEVQLDPQNRVLIPAVLREHAGLGGKVLIVGTGESFEIWSPERYDSDLDRIAPLLPSMFDAIEERRG